MRYPSVLLQVETLESRVVPSTWFVSPSGDDGAAGTQQDPWRTLQAAADRVQAGDTVVVRPGQYAGFDLWTDGTAAAPITFRVEPGAVIDAPNQRTPDGINLEGADYIVVEGFTITGVPRAGIRSVVNHHVTIRNNTADQNGRWGVFTGFSDDLLIENNVTSRSQAEHGIYVSNSGDRPVIRGNQIWGNRSNGIHMNGDQSQGGDGVISDALVEDNTIWDNGLGGGSGINADGVQSSRFQNNLLHDNHASGISLYRIDGGAGSHNNVVVNNTVVMASDSRWALNIRDGSTGNTVYNNILYTAHSYRGSITISTDSLPGFTSDFNVVMERFTTNDGNSVMDLAGWRSLTGQDQNSVVATPSELFVDGAVANYHLKTGSPAIDRGTSQQAPAVDLDGEARPAGPAWDVGAFEAPGDEPPPEEGTVRLEPDSWNPGGLALVVWGTQGRDVIAFNPVDGGQGIQVKLNKVDKGTFAVASLTRLVAFGLGGNDRIIVNRALTVPAFLSGGDGRDTLKAGAGDDVLLGGADADVLVGKNGRDLLFGGLGADTLKGQGGEDLLVSGTTAHDDEDWALRAIHQEWTSSRTYQERTTRLASGIDGLPRLDAGTVFADTAADSLLGGSGALDWFFALVGQDGTDRRGNERLN